MGDKIKGFLLFDEDSEFTDDSVMTVAVAKALLDSFGQDDSDIKKTFVYSMKK